MIHEKSHVDETCKVALSARVWQFASVLRGSTIGHNTTVGAGAVIDGARIGQDCKIAAQAFIPPGITIGDRVFIGPGVRFCNDRLPSVDQEGWRMPGHGDIVSCVANDCSIGASAIIMPGVSIGEGSFIAAGAVVTGKVPEGSYFSRSGRIYPHSGEGERRMNWLSERLV